MSGNETTAGSHRHTPDWGARVRAQLQAIPELSNCLRGKGNASGVRLDPQGGIVERVGGACEGVEGEGGISQEALTLFGKICAP